MAIGISKAKNVGLDFGNLIYQNDYWSLVNQIYAEIFWSKNVPIIKFCIPAVAVS
jgi:hypothetical protein